MTSITCRSYEYSFDDYLRVMYTVTTFRKQNMLELDTYSRSLSMGILCITVCLFVFWRRFNEPHGLLKVLLVNWQSLNFPNCNRWNDRCLPWCSHCLLYVRRPLQDFWRSNSMVLLSVTSSQLTLTAVILPRNYFCRRFATFIFLTSIMAAEHANEAMLPFTAGLIVWAIGMGLGGTTGFAMNQARDLGPRFAYQILPIKDKVNDDWQLWSSCTRYCSICWCCSILLHPLLLGIM